MNFKFHPLACLTTTALALSLIVAGCAGVGSSSSDQNSALGPLTETSAHYATLAESGDNTARLLLARSLISEGNYQKAAELITTVQNSTDSALVLKQAALVNARLKTALGQYDEAATILERLPSGGLSTQDETYREALSSTVFESRYLKTRNSADLLRAYQSERNLLNLVQPGDRKAVLNRTVSLLGKLPEDELGAAAKRAGNTVDEGFFSYALIAKSGMASVKQELQQSFRAQYPGHPLNELWAATPAPASATPGNVPQGSLSEIADNSRIAVILPLSGRFAEHIGNPARLGIVAALQDRHAAVKAVFYDSNKFTIDQIIRAISTDGTAMILGPILKPEVEALNHSGLSVPSIVFNQVASRPVNQWFFDLSPEYEGSLASAKIQFDGHHNPAVIHSSAKGSQRAASTFVNNWSTVERVTPVTCTFTGSDNATAAASGCALNGADSIYINGSPLEASNAIKGLPGGLPVYLTGSSSDGVTNSAAFLSFNGAMLGDMPWLLTDSALKENFMKSIPRANAQAQRIFAAAYDSVNLAFNLRRLGQNSNDVLHGLSGDLSLGSGGRIERAPLWIRAGSRP